MYRPLLAILLLAVPGALVACGDKGEDTNDKVDADADGDGYDAITEGGDDCDDTNASINPGAAEAWYDGIDSDCDGGDDYDADQDGVRSENYDGADCDDSDASISPVVEETWYDGVDGNCDGGDDFDADADTFAAVVGGGEDCDDEDATIWPGAAETWYDGVDGDCDGGSDNDADGDGYDSDGYDGTDCDDTDATVSPAGTETWYDGADGDCDGNSDYDADSDGYDSDLYGGNDCADDDPDSSPGENEKIDGHDSDCDGTGDRFSVEEDYGGSVLLGLEYNGGLGVPMIVGDYDSDGADDVIAAEAAGGDEGMGAVYVVSGSTLVAGSTITTRSADVTLSSVWGAPDALELIDGLDTSGDPWLAVGERGAADVAVGIDLGVVYLFAGSELSSDRLTSDAKREIWGATEGDGLGSDVLDAGDMDGDGTNEVVIAGAGLSTWVFLGDDLSSSGSWSTADAAATWLSSETVSNGYGCGFLGRADDLDGDGYPEILVGQSGYEGGRVLVVDGNLGLSTADLDTLATAVLTTTGGGDLTGFSVTSGDLDGDGTADVVVGAPGADSVAGRVFVLSGAGMGSGTIDLSTDSLVSWGGTTALGNAGSSLASGRDVDGEGSDDLLIGGYGDSSGGTDSGEVWLVLSGRTGGRSLTSADASFTGGSSRDLAGAFVAIGDLDADGSGDLLFSVPSEDGSEGGEGAVYVGFSGY